jgi:hypothetical protein
VRKYFHSSEKKLWSSSECGDSVTNHEEIDREEGSGRYTICGGFYLGGTEGRWFSELSSLSTASGLRSWSSAMAGESDRSTELQKLWRREEEEEEEV